MENVLACFFFELKLDTNEGTASKRTHLHIFIKFIIRNQRKNSETEDETK